MSTVINASSSQRSKALRSYAAHRGAARRVASAALDRAENDIEATYQQLKAAGVSTASKPMRALHAVAERIEEWHAWMKGQRQ